MDFTIVPPAGGYPPFTKFMLSGLNLCLEKLFEQEVLLTTNSGKSALYSVFFALKKLHSANTVVIPSYSCPDIAVAALRAGLNVELAPVSNKTLQMDKEYLLSLKSKDCAAIVFANLYGMPDEIPSGIDSGILLIDDLCQSLLSKEERQVEISIFSSGRGKSICGLGGGGVLLKKGNEFATRVFDLAKSEIDILPKASFLSELKVLLQAMLISTLEKPVFYSLLFRLAPFLNLGKVVIDLDFEPGKMSKVQNLYAAFQYQEAKSNNPWSKVLVSKNLVQPFLERKFIEPVHLIRYPVLLGSQEKRDKIVKELRSCGVSASYGNSLMEFEPLKDKISFNSNVQPIEGLLTLPVHKNVSQDIINKVVSTLVGKQQ